MNDITVSFMEMADIEEVMEIEEKSFNIPWPRQAFVKELCDNKFACYLVARWEGRVVAYGGMWFILDEAHITNIAVHPDYREKGIGTRLLKEMIAYGVSREITSFTLEVKVSNQKAINLYKKEGFEAAGTRKGYYSDTLEDALIMWLKL